MRMVVQETARSAGKASGATPAVAAGALSALLMGVSAHAQIVASPTAPPGQRPVVLVAPNGVPLVNIQTPTAAGVSRNVFTQFDVMRNGAILNNSRTNVQTQLGGYVQGNPWLARRRGARDRERGERRQPVAAARDDRSGRATRRGHHREPGRDRCSRCRVHQRQQSDADHRAAAIRRHGRARQLRGAQRHRDDQRRKAWM